MVVTQLLKYNILLKYCSGPTQNLFAAVLWWPRHHITRTCSSDIQDFCTSTMLKMFHIGKYKVSVTVRNNRENMTKALNSPFCTLKLPIHGGVLRGSLQAFSTFFSIWWVSAAYCHTEDTKLKLLTVYDTKLFSDYCTLLLLSCLLLYLSWIMTPLFSGAAL